MVVLMQHRNYWNSLAPKRIMSAAGKWSGKITVAKRHIYKLNLSTFGMNLISGYVKRSEEMSLGLQSKELR